MKQSLLILSFILLPISLSGVTKHGTNPLFNSLDYKIMCGYQGWFTGKNDGSGYDWKHYSKKDTTVNPNVSRFEPGFSHISYWPDTRELDNDELFPTAFRLANGDVAYVYSAYKRKTVERHYRWMQEYGIDGTFVQRFISNTRIANSNQLRLRNFNDSVLMHCFSGAKKYNRSLAVMYDLSSAVSTDKAVLMNDWKHLVNDLKVTTQTPNNYLYHNGKPLVCLWGIGFGDAKHGGLSLLQMDSLITFFKTDPVYGGCAVLIGVPFSWRLLKYDATTDPYLWEVIKHADFINPWAVGRFRTIDFITQTNIRVGVANTTYDKVVEGDLAWCSANGVGYLPSIWPGSYTYNMDFNTADFGSSSTTIRGRNQGNFLWQQAYNNIDNGAKSMYATMFDEMDEGTCLFKCTSDYPVNIYDKYLDYEGFGSDYYLWMVGELSRQLRGETANVSVIAKQSKVADFSATINTTNKSASTLTFKITNLFSGRKVYMSSAYVIPYGAPTVGAKRNSLYFPTQITADISNVISCKQAHYLTFIEVDPSDNVISYKSVQNDFATAVDNIHANGIKWTVNNQQLEISFNDSFASFGYLRLLDINGKLQKIIDVNSDKISVDMRQFVHGVYVVESMTNNEFGRIKIVY
ncbi:MAG: hypothetical protein GZ091_05635 [Paludibacter sp.]|nr:hypothetical protein [Paludibacter sp.]